MLRFSYPQPVEDYRPEALPGTGCRIGVIARADPAQAWAVAHRRFPVDPDGEKRHDLASHVVESHWHRGLSAQAAVDAAPRGTYWLYPFRTYRTFRPYLVGSYAEGGGAAFRPEICSRTTCFLRRPRGAVIRSSTCSGAGPGVGGGRTPGPGPVGPRTCSAPAAPSAGC